MSLKLIRSKIDTALGTIAGLNHSDKIPSVVVPPFAFPALHPTDPVTYDFTAGNASLVYHFYIEILVNKGATLEQAQDDLDPYLHNKGAQSIKTAIEAIIWPPDADVCRITGVANYGSPTYGGVEYAGARLLCDIWVSD